MKISTVSAVVGGYGCNARCPFCVRNMTPHTEYDTQVNEPDLHIGCRLGQQAGATTCLITGKGEPTLYEKQLTQTISIVAPYFPFVELQTNGMNLPLLDESGYLHDWHALGLRTICLSTTHWDAEKNREIYGDQYLELQEIKDILDKNDLRLRLSVVMYKGGVDKIVHVNDMIQCARKLGNKGRKVQLTIRPMVLWDNKSETAEWTKKHLLNDSFDVKPIYDWVKSFPTIMTLSNGATIHDVNGQNLCITDCLTTNKSTEEMRQIILYPDGTISYDWKYESAFLM